VTGKRSLAKLNSFDLVVTVALGSTLATILLNKDVSLVEGVSALTLLLVLQFVGSWLSTRSHTVRSLLTAEPSLVFFRGRFLRDAMKRERVTEAHVLTAIRKGGAASTEDVHAVVLETSGDLSCILSSPRSRDRTDDAIPTPAAHRGAQGE
jgi:uncharacterized membrane protein YcaP (DUF421 family)